MSEILFDLIDLIIDVVIELGSSGSKSSRFNSFGGKRMNLHDTDNYVSDFDALPYQGISKKRSTNTTTRNNYINRDGVTPVGESYHKDTELKTTAKPPLTDHDSFSHTNINDIKLEILLLNYMFNEDDGKISRKESKMIKDHFKKFKGVLKADDIKEISSFRNLDNSLMNIRAFISQNPVSEGCISKGINLLKHIDHKENRYHSVINRIESALLDAMGY